MQKVRTFTVLIVEDNLVLCKDYKDIFADFDEEYTLLFASGVEEGVAIFNDHQNVNAIVVDGVLSPEGNFGRDFVRRTRPLYRGPMFASSTSSEMNEEMRRLGCNYVVPSKYSVPQHVRQILLERTKLSTT